MVKKLGLTPHLNVLDSKDMAGNTFSQYHDLLQAGPLPFTAPEDPGQGFACRFESIGVRGGSIGVGRSTPHIVEITKTDISRASNEFFMFGTRVSCSMAIDQAGRQNIARSGDLLVYDTARPTRMLGGSAPVVNNVIIVAPKDAFSGLACAEDYFTNACVPRDRLLPALAQCLALIGDQISSATPEELTALYDASISLLPVAMGCYIDRFREIETSQTSAAYREIISCVNESLSEQRLSPGYVAQKLGLSESGIHKVFARRGMTFSMYVKDQRLDRARLDLTAIRGQEFPISAVASRWGFSDLSTFYRAFKARFKCTPKEFRARNR